MRSDGEEGARDREIFYRNESSLIARTKRSSGTVKDGFKFSSATVTRQNHVKTDKYLSTRATRDPPSHILLFVCRCPPGNALTRTWTTEGHFPCAARGRARRRRGGLPSPALADATEASTARARIGLAAATGASRTRGTKHTWILARTNEKDGFGAGWRVAERAVRGVAGGERGGGFWGRVSMPGGRHRDDAGARASSPAGSPPLSSP